MNLDFDGFLQTSPGPHWAAKSATALLLSPIVASDLWWEALVAGFWAVKNRRH